MENEPIQSFSSYGAPGDSTSPSLLQALKAGAPGAWSKIVEVWGVALIVFFRNKGFNAEDADDLTQIVMAKMYRGIVRFERDGVRLRLVHWVYDIARKEAITLRRKNSKKPLSPGGDAHQESMTAVPDNVDLDAESDSEKSGFDSIVVKQIMSIVQTDFKPNTWKAFLRFKVDGLTAKDAGEEVGISDGAVRVATNRILKRIREELDGPEPKNGAR